MEERFKKVNALAQALHGDTAAADGFTFRSMREHVDEIAGLLADGDDHWKAEAVDLILHNHLLLSRHGAKPGEIEELMGRRIGRFEEKIRAAMKDRAVQSAGVFPSGDAEKESL